MGSYEDFQAGKSSGLEWWNTGRISLFSPCAGPLSNSMSPGSTTLYSMDHQAEMKQAQTAYSRSDDSDDHHSSSAEHLPVMSPDYTHIFQDAQKPLMADFGSSDWLQNTLLNDVSSNMAIFNLVADYDDLKNNNDRQGFYNLDQFDSNTKVSQMGLGNNTTPSSYAYTSMQQNLAGPETNMSYNFDNNFVASATSFMHSLYQKQQQNPGTRQGSYNAASSPFWNGFWEGREEIGAREPHKISLPALLEGQKPHSTMSTIPKIESKNLSHKLANSTVLGTKRSKNNASDEVYKRPRIVTPSSLPTFKVRKEKLGDRITALQQLVSPFGKTDTASVLHEAVEYIKFLHEQVLRTPYVQNGTPVNQHQQMHGESKNSASSEGPKQDLRSRGLCLVPISSTFPVANESTADFWTPTFGGTMTFR